MMPHAKVTATQDWQEMAVLPARVVVLAPPERRRQMVKFAGILYRVLVNRARRVGTDPLWEGNPVPLFHALVTELLMLTDEARSFGEAGEVAAQALTAATAEAREAMREAPPLALLQNLRGVRYRPFAIALMVDETPIPGLAALDGVIGDALTHQTTQEERRQAWQEDLEWIRTVLVHHIAARDSHDPPPDAALRPYCHLAAELAGRLTAVPGLQAVADAGRRLSNRATNPSRAAARVVSGPVALKNQGPPGPSTTAPNRR